MPMRNLMKRIASDISGATAVEYGLILALIFLAMIIGIRNFSDVTIAMWDDVSNQFAASSEQS